MKRRKYTVRNGVPVLLLAGLISQSFCFARAAEYVTYLHTDVQGSPLLATDEGGQVIWQEEYGPWGTRQLKDQASATLGRGAGTWYTGKEEEASLGMYYYGARWYSQDIGQFSRTDPAAVSLGHPRSFNRYAYANDNPIMYVDPDGMQGELFWTATNHVIYTIRWTMTGVPTSNFTPATVNAQISQDFSGKVMVNGKAVSITAIGVYVKNPTSQSVNTVTVVPDTATVTASGRSETNGIGGNRVIVGASGLEPATERTMSHELGGHAGGAGDQYKGGLAVNGSILPADIPGPPNVMKDLMGRPSNQQTRREILAAPTNANSCAKGVHAANGGC